VSSSISISQHLEKVKSFCKFIQTTTEIDMSMVLWDTLDEAVKNE